MNWKRNGNILQIECRKLLEIKDNYHKDLQATCKQEGEEEVDIDKEVHKDKIVSSPNQMVLQRWNAEAERLGLSKILTLSDKRLKAVTARLAEKEFDLELCFKRIEESSFVRGENDRGWKIDFDWLFGSTTNHLKLLEGKYSGTNRRSNRQAGAGGTTTQDDLKRSLEMARRLADARKARGE
jgi:hypothetical protein